MKNEMLVKALVFIFENYLLVTLTSILLFSALPSAVSLDAVGVAEP